MDKLSLPQPFRFRLLGMALLPLFILCSCSTQVARRDGAPKFHIDETKIPDAVPKVEPLAKYGNMSSYRVFGKRYYTLSSSRAYEAVGTASWYGTKFHAQRTSSGEPYNMLGMTAAHKTLPLPTYVSVTNLKNHRTIIVKVNDRGPFESNRIIDLSYVAAKKLGMLGHGTALVRVKAIDPTEYRTAKLQLARNNLTSPTLTAPRAWQRKTPLPMYYLQVGAFRHKSGAEKLRQQLLAQLNAPITISHPSATTLFYRVQVGPIQDTATAQQVTASLKMLGIKPNRIAGA